MYKAIQESPIFIGVYSSLRLNPLHTDPQIKYLRLKSNAQDREGGGGGGVGGGEA